MPPNQILPSEKSYSMGAPSPKNSARRRKSVQSTQILDDTKYLQVSRLRVPLKAIIIVSLCLFTVGPAILLWLLSWKSGKDGLDSMEALGTSSVEDVANQLQLTLITGAASKLAQLTSPAEQAAVYTLSLAQGQGVLDMDGAIVGANFSEIWNRMKVLIHTCKTSSTLTMLNFNVYSAPHYAYSGSRVESKDGLRLTSISNWWTHANLNLDLLAGNNDPTIYLAETNLNEYLNESVMRYFYLDQATGDRMFPLLTSPLGIINQVSEDPTRPTYYLWSPRLFFNANTGIPQIILDAQQPFTDGKACVHIQVMLSVFTVSAFLRGMLKGEKERMFLNFRAYHGDLIGASHGKFFSHSDKDYSRNNPLIDPPPVKDFRTYTPLNSTDSTIQQVGQWVVQTYTDWDALPPINTVITINNFTDGTSEPYWVASDAVTSSMGLSLNLFLIIDRNSKMGRIETNKKKTLDDIQRTNNNLTIILVCVVVGAFLFALIISILLTTALGQLAFGMDTLALLKFEDDLKSMLTSESRFSEVSKCERSFVALERGLKAFVKYVPKDVVRCMLSGEMESNNIMVRKVISILFMDIAGFSTMCEKIPAEQLMRLTSDYLQEMCKIIVNSKGTLDKFIGDCIMAMWNAPRSLKKHEAHAIGAALDMQAALMELCEIWAEEGIPSIRFRVGINTDAVLVGNFGCDYRINYTCLGDGVNLASRLEAANKPFGTVVLVAETTRNNASKDFFFRKIGNITVPGKAEILTIYEPLFRATEDVATEQPTPAETEKRRLNNSIDGERRFTVSVSPSPDSTPSPIYHAWKPSDKSTLIRLTEAYEKGINEYLPGNLDAARKWFLKAQEIVPTDGATQLLLEQCKLGKKVGEQWDGVIRFDHK